MISSCLTATASGWLSRPVRPRQRQQENDPAIGLRERVTPIMFKQPPHNKGVVLTRGGPSVRGEAQHPPSYSCTPRATSVDQDPRLGHTSAADQNEPPLPAGRFGAHKPCAGSNGRATLGGINSIEDNEPVSSTWQSEYSNAKL